MALPRPAPGLVIRYSYLWHGEHLQGRDEGQKDRPCAIIASIPNDEAGDIRVLVLPVTHSPPEHPGLAVEIPWKAKPVVYRAHESRGACSVRRFVK